MTAKRNPTGRVGAGRALPKRPRAFATPAKWRAWLGRHHADAAELWVLFYKKASGRPSITWPESVDGALCFGWIDGLRKGVNEASYAIRFTPRRPGSIWSDVNSKRFRKLERAGQVSEAGRRAFAVRRAERAGVYSFEQKPVALPPVLARRFRANRGAWTFFQSQPPGYRRVATWWVISAKREETRLRRLGTLIADSAAGRRIGQLQRPGKPA